jgi:hypothetical protein
LCGIELRLDKASPPVRRYLESLEALRAAHSRQSELMLRRNSMTVYWGRKKWRRETFTARLSTAQSCIDQRE